MKEAKGKMFRQLREGEKARRLREEGERRRWKRSEQMKEEEMQK